VDKPSVNPEHNAPLVPEEQRNLMERARLYELHKAHGSLGVFYDLYPEMRPTPEPEPEQKRGRSR
jgi:hypothetical protein